MIALLLACGGPMSLDAATVEGGIEVRADRPLRRVVVTTEAGAPVTTIALPAPSSTVSVPVAPPIGARWTVRGEGPGGAAASAAVEGPAGPVTIELEAPAGQGRRRVADGDRIDVLALPGARGALVLTASRAVTAAVRVDGAEQDVALRAPGDRATVEVPLEGARRVEVQVGDDVVGIEVRARPLDPERARRELRVTDVRLPADALGRPDPTLPADTIVLPTRVVGGWRRTDAPWTWQAVTLANDAEAPVDVVVRADVVDARGPVAAFRSRREGAGAPYVAAIARVPAGGEEVVALPLYVDRDAVPDGELRRRIAVTPLGAAEALHVVERPLAVSRGSRFGWPVFLAAVGVSAAGWGMLALGGRAFLRSVSTADLVTIGLFGSLTFVVGAAFQLLGMGVAALLGPFAPLLTGLPDDAFRAVLLGTLITLVPRPGVVAAATVVGFLMRGLALGSFHPADLLFLGTTVLLHEVALWLAGPSRGRGGWWRLTLGLGGANVVGVLLGLATTAVLYRLYFAAWYVAALALLPGFLYVAVGCRLAVPVAESLRRVAP